MRDTIPILAIIIALTLGYAVTVINARQQWQNEAEIKKLIAEAKRRHAPRKSLYRRLVDLRCQQLRREG